MRSTIAFALAALLSACAAQSPSPRAEAVTLRLPGFTATTPAAPRWIVTPGGGEAQAAVRRIGESRTVTAFASQEGLTAGTPAEALDRAIAEIRFGYDSGRHRLRAFESSVEGERCRNYRLTAEDAGVPGGADRLYIVMARGSVCVIDDRHLLARLEYSDRHVEGEPPLSSFEDEAAAFLRSLPAPGA
jgi:hypothetical protein